MLRRRAESSFPVPLWGSLLLALLALTQPVTVRALESWGSRVVVVPLRVLFALTPREVSGAESDDARRAPARAALEAFQLRVEAVSRRRPPGIDVERAPLPLRVLERHGSVHGQSDELILDRRRDDLGDCADYVTVGDVLVGFLAPEGAGETAFGVDADLRGLARVVLLSHTERGRLPRRVPARIDLGEGRPLAFLVEPSSPVDRWPLRCALLDDPYRAARLGSGEHEVVTSGLAEDPLGTLPQGLRIGALRIFGYRDPGGRVLPIGFEVQPTVAPDAIDVVTLWQDVAITTAPPRAVRSTSVRVHLTRLPVPSEGRTRYFATPSLGTATLRPGAGVFDGARLFGICEEGGPGFAIVAPFGQLGRVWRLVFAPDDTQVDPIPFAARARAARDDTVVFDVVDGVLPQGPGAVHASSGSRDLPGGAFVGRGTMRAGGTLQVERASLPVDGTLSVHLHTALAETAR